MFDGVVSWVSDLRENERVGRFGRGFIFRVLVRMNSEKRRRLVSWVLRFCSFIGYFWGWVRGCWC